MLFLILTSIVCGQHIEINESRAEDIYTNIHEMPKTMPSDFQIVFTFGLKQANQHDGLNTQEGTVQKDLIKNGLAISNINVKKESLKEIYGLLRKINIISYANNYKPLYMDNPPDDNMKYVTPSQVYNIYIVYGGNEYFCYWHDINASETEEAVKLRDTLEDIKELIRALDEYKDLGESNGFYE